MNTRPVVLIGISALAVLALLAMTASAHVPQEYVVEPLLLKDIRLHSHQRPALHRRQRLRQLPMPPDICQLRPELR